MGMKIFMTVVFLPILGIMYAILLYTGNEKNRFLFGVTLWKGAEENPQVIEIRKKYRKNLNLWALMLLISYFSTCITHHFSIYFTMLMIWMFAVITLLFVPYIQANHSMLKLKREYKVKENQEIEKELETYSETLVDLTAATEAEERPKLFEKSAVGAMIFAFLPMLLDLYLEKSWKNLEAPDLWLREILLFSMASITILGWLIVRYYNRSATKVVSLDSEINIQLSRIRRYQWGNCWNKLNWFSGLYCWGMLLSLHLPGSKMLLVLLVSSLLYTGIVIWLTVRCYYIVTKSSRKYLANVEVLTDDDKYWIWGIFYDNKNDNRLLVDKNVGIGTTFNMAKTSAKVITIGISVFTAIILFGSCILITVEEFTPIKLTYEQNMIVASQWKEEYRVLESQIKSVTLLEKLPRMTKRAGTGMDTLKKGSFFSREQERGFKVCLNPQNAPYLMIETVGGTWYLLGDDEKDTTLEIYKELETQIKE
ncbi:MAG: hypothetical protein RRY80_08410 [Lachnospiraceae bacterium]